MRHTTLFNISQIGHYVEIKKANRGNTTGLLRWNLEPAEAALPKSHSMMRKFDGRPSNEL